MGGNGRCDQIVVATSAQGVARSVVEIDGFVGQRSGKPEGADAFDRDVAAPASQARHLAVRIGSRCLQRKANRNERRYQESRKDLLHPKLTLFREVDG